MPNTMPMLAALPAFISNNADWAFAALIVILGLFVYGLPDLLRTRFGRIWAISGVCFRDAIRRRVLWITPLAMLGILLVGQFQRPVDQQDAIRLTIKVCLFTTGMVVTIIALITAATNLPREIENRVVFTIVTKPVTRLEIVLGKIVGFARVSAAMLLVMGAFSLVYLHSKAWWLGRQINDDLQSARLEPTQRVWLTHYQEQGLLQSRTVEQADSLMQYARPPVGNEAGGWILGQGQDAVAQVPLAANALVSKAAPDSPGGSVGLQVVLHVGFEPIKTDFVAKTEAEQPHVAVQFLDPNSGIVLLSADQLGRGAQAVLTDPTGDTPVVIAIPPEKAITLATASSADVQLLCGSASYLYHVRPDAVALAVPDAPGVFRSLPATQLFLRGSTGRSGQQLGATSRGVSPVAVYAYRDAATPTAKNGQVPFELNVNVERGGDSEDEANGTVEVRAYDRKGSKLSPPTTVFPESRRTVFFDLPAEYVSGGDFDLQLTNRASGHTLGLSRVSVQMVSAQGYFGLNLLKALLVLWLLAILTATVAFWCSTFLSWPIAVVLTVLLVLGHWAVSNVDLGSGIGAQVATDFFPNNAMASKLTNTSVEQLSHVLTLLASVLPDITSFGVSEQLEQGVTLSLAELAGPLKVLVVFGLPLVTVAYVFLRNKEVAP